MPLYQDDNLKEFKEHEREIDQGIQEQRFGL